MSTAAPTAVDPVRAETDARAWWDALGAPPAPLVDEAGARVVLAPGERLTRITRHARLLVISDRLAIAVAALLAGHGVHAVVARAHTETATAQPGEGQEADEAVAHEQRIAARRAMCLRAGEVLVPIVPGSTTLRLYPATTEELLTDPLREVQIPAEQGGWVPAPALAAALAPELAH
ncbi:MULTISPECIES: hypothetical protein [Actinosynnema]|uniref:hypothetical protein n=1 Tax=Actinosynnema TaxID=40566 RepID=UPI0020A49C5F|nr:hypothetical protein [Actinosynnema pretiosum]MCP2097274.1 hypothetical protein [Actinosynnema pretiosum]